MEIELSVVIPVWTDGHTLRRLLPGVAATLSALTTRSEIVVADATGRLGPVAGADTRVVRADGPGYGSALRAGLAAATGEHVVTVDADSASPPGVIRSLWEHRGRADALIASRYLPASVVEMPAARRALSRPLNRLYRAILALPYRDLSSGFRLYHRRVLDDVGPLEASGLDALQEVVVKAVCQGWHVREVPMYYVHSQAWSPARYRELATGYLATTSRLFLLRNSVKAADYDNRAFDSWIPLQRYWQRERYRIILRMVQGARSILDVGCGSSRIIQHLPGAVGMDLQLRKLRWLRGPGRRLLQADMNRLPFPDGAFDAVVCSEVIEHIPREQVHLEELVRVIRPGGLLILGTPDYGRWTWRTLEWIYGKVFPNGYVKEHVNQYTRSSLTREMRDLGLQVGAPAYVGHSEMIFRARVPQAPGSSAGPITEPSGFVAAGSTGA